MDQLKWRDGMKVTAGLSHGTTPDDYRDAMSGDGPLAGTWLDKPHRLVYDLAGEVLRLQAHVAELEHALWDVEWCVDAESGIEKCHWCGGERYIGARSGQLIGGHEANCARQVALSAKEGQ